MRIPEEALPPYPANGSHFAEASGTRPVSGSASLTGQLPESLPHARPTPLSRPKSEARDEHDEGDARDQRPEQAPPQDRRHAERRQKNVPVTLDTRLTPSRRRSASPTVNVEI